MNEELESLDDLIAAALASVKAKPPKHHSKRPIEPHVEPEALFTDPTKWARKRGVALIHEETQTLLGTFIEFIHTTGARRLTRTEEPVLVELTESVSGDWWLGEGREEVAPAESWDERREAILHLELPTLGVHSPACLITAHLRHGGIARVDLNVDTMFAQQGGTEHLLFLPAGTNVLPVMGLDCKIALRMELEA